MHAHAAGLAPCLLVAAACGGRSPAVIAPAPAEIAPAELQVPGISEYRDRPMFLADRIYVLGMSRDRIAYLNEPADEACGCYTPEIVVQQLRGDAIVWKDSYDSGELDAANETQLKNLDQLWRARGADWERHLQEHGVARAPVTALVTLPNGGTALPRFEVHGEQLDDPELGYVHLTSYRIELVTDDDTREIASSTSKLDNYDRKRCVNPTWRAGWRARTMPGCEGPTTRRSARS